MKRSILGILFLPIALVGAACSSGDSFTPTMSAVEIAVTDAPFENWMVETAVVTVDRVTLHEDADGVSDFITVMEGKELSLDLTKLTNGATEIMTQAVIPPGEYSQARLHFTSAYIRTVNGRVFSSAEGTLQIANYPASGFKVLMDPPVHAHVGATMRLLLDFDLSKSFRPVPADEPLLADSVLLLPSIRCVDEKEAGELRGMVMEDIGGVMTSVEDAFVYILPPGEPDMTNRVATTGTEEDGSFALIGVKPGTYDLVAMKGTETRMSSIAVAKGKVTTMDVVLE